MFVVREASLDDLPTLLEMARGVNFINLPPHEDVLKRKIESSQRSFRAARASADPPHNDKRWERVYLFVLHDLEGRCVGTSSISAGMGNPEHPNLSYQIVKTLRRSLTLAGTMDHPSGIVENYLLRMFRDRSSPTELGGLLLRPRVRGGGLGRLIGWTRFHYIARHRPWFSDRMLAEMMAILDRYNDGNAFWRALPRKFINMSYQQADRLSTREREFMYSLLPDHINLALLPSDAVAVMGEVGEMTRPARRMLEELGFRYTHRIDPFDAGPHLEANTGDITAIQLTRKATMARELEPSGSPEKLGLISVERDDTGFAAVAGRYYAELGSSEVALSGEIVDALGLKIGDEVWVTPYDIAPQPPETEPLPVVMIPDMSKLDSYEMAELYEHTDGRGPWPEESNPEDSGPAHSKPDAPHVAPAPTPGIVRGNAALPESPDHAAGGTR
ncbi:MAG: arginine N-succinyltransferase [Phycisphaerales bacterium]